jgi:hypothetical protein
MALSNYVKNDVQGSITLKDGTGTPVTMDVDFDLGDVSLSGLSEKLNESVNIERRGKLKDVGYGARTYPSLSFSILVAQFTDASADVVTDFLLRQGKFSGNISTLGAGRPYAVDVVFTIEGTAVDGTDHTWTAHDFVPNQDFSEGSPADTIAVSGDVRGPITGDIACSEI